MPELQQLSASQASPEVPINENFETLEAIAVYGKKHPTTTGLTWGYYGGRWGGFAVAAGTLILTASNTNYIVVARATGVISVSTSATNWNDTTNYARVYRLTAGALAVTAVEDHRAGPNGVHGGGGGGSSSSAGPVGFEFTASSATTDSDPGTGTLRWNNATQASATQLFVDNTDADGTNLASLWASIPANSFVTISESANPEVWQLWKVTAVPTDGTGYYKFAVTLQAQEGGNIANTTAIRLAVDVSGASSTTGKHSIPISAGALRPSTSGGCASLSSVAIAAGQPDIITLDFDATAEEYALIQIAMPKSWNEGTITAKFYWSHADTTTNFGVAWGIQAVARGDADSMASNFGTAQVVTDTGGTTDTLYVSAETAAVTIAGSPAAEDLVFFRVFRQVSNGADNMAIDARLHGIALFVTTDASNDA